VIASHEASITAVAETVAETTTEATNVNMMST
jgi:hypothetical protein